MRRRASVSAIRRCKAPVAIGRANAPAADVFAAKADAVAALASLGIDQDSLTVAREAPAWFHPGRSGALKLGPKVTLGVFGELHPDVLAKLGVDAPIAGFELYLDAIPAAKRKSLTKPALDASDLQAVKRDFAFLLDADVAAADVVRAAQGADRALITEVGVFDVFTGQGVPEGKKSLAIEVTLQPREKTLTDSEIEADRGEDRRRRHQGHRRRAERLALLLVSLGKSPRRVIEAEIVIASEMDHGALGERGDGQQRIDADGARDHRAVADIEPGMDAAVAIEDLAFVVDHAMARVGAHAAAA